MENPPPKTSLSRRFILPFLIITIMLMGKLIGNNQPHSPIVIATMPIDFIMFGGTLLCIALSHRMRWEPRDIALSGLGLVLAHQLYIGTDLIRHLTHDQYHESRGLANISGLLLGFAVMSKCFEHSKFGDWLPFILPNDWKGPAVLLAAVLCVSSFLDNIAAAMIGGVIAKEVFKGKLSVGFLAAIVACSNAGGAPSVVGDTTTTMMWIDGVSPFDVFHAAVGSMGAGMIIVYFGAKQQDQHQRILKDPEGGLPFKDIRWSYLTCMFWALAGCIAGNVLIDFPAVGLWVALVTGSFLVGREHMPFSAAGHIVKETVFILALVAMAGLMPVKTLPEPSPITTFGFGYVSAVFDNIPLTKLMLTQGGYDWGIVAYAVGYGGSMLWFGSSAGVALCSMFPEGKDVFAWLRQGWFVSVGYIAGFGLMMITVGWHPHPTHRAQNHSTIAPTTSEYDLR